jgi:threonine synthase
MNEARMENVHDCDSCERVTLETAKEYLCPDCSTEYDAEIKHLNSEIDIWKETSKVHYKAMVKAKLALKKANETCEFLRMEVNRKDQQMKFLR